MTHLSRRTMIAGAAMAAPGAAFAENARPVFGIPPSVVTNPPRRWGDDAPPDMFPDPDVIVIDKSFSRYLVGLAALKRLATGFQWAEGPAWCSEGAYAVFSDVKGSTQYRYIWESGKISPFRKPSFNSNGNSFDFQGRQISTQDFFRRVVRWELDGSMTVIADSYEGKPLNSPNDLAPHPDGSIWFTDPAFGISLSEGHPDVRGAENPNGLYDAELGNLGVGLVGGVEKQNLANTYRWDPSGRLDIAVPNAAGRTPNGICFSPDYKTMYLINDGGIDAFDMVGTKATNKRLFTDCMVDGVHCGPDGMRADRAGNLWVGSNAPLGYCGATVWDPQGKILGRIRLPEICANLCFAGPKRDYLFMAASQSAYMLRVNIQGAAPG